MAARIIKTLEARVAPLDDPRALGSALGDGNNPLLFSPSRAMRTGRKVSKVMTVAGGSCAGAKATKGGAPAEGSVSPSAPDHWHAGSRGR